MNPNGIDRVWLAPAGTAGTPLDASPAAGWVEGGRAYASDELAPQPNSRNDLMGRPVTTTFGLDNALVELVDGERYDEMVVFNETAVVCALLFPDGKFRLLTGVRASVRYMPNSGAETNQTVGIYLRGVAVRSSTMLSRPTAPAT